MLNIMATQCKLPHLSGVRNADNFTAGWRKPGRPAGSKNVPKDQQKEHKRETDIAYQRRKRDQTRALGEENKALREEIEVIRKAKEQELVIDKDFLQKIAEEVKTKHGEVVRRVNTEILTADDVKKKSRRYSDLLEFSAMLETVQLGQPINLETYRKLKAHQCYDEPIYLACSSAEARELLTGKDRLLPIQILVVDAYRAGGTLSIHDILDRISLYDSISVQTSTQAPGEESAKTMDTEEAIATFRDPNNQYPINFLDLRVSIQNPVPPFIQNIPRFSMLDQFHEDRYGMGKAMETVVADLSASSYFSLLGKKGVFSLDHMDRARVMTGVQPIEGEKLWYVRSRMRRSEMQYWATTKKFPPGSIPFPIYLKYPYYFLQMPGTVHCPYSMTDVLMHGIMCWDAQEMTNVVKQSLCELAHPHITNEDPAKQIGGKLRLIQKAANHPGFSALFGRSFKIEEFRRLIDVCKLGHRASRTLTVCRYMYRGRR
jgi:hypothetical protein